ncbi:MAG TPA: D-alanyl-D-alanine carboxypeptidase/D-alanyl-D-alanine-endopeptidase, partial [Terriglobales bacterium]|nr:D-alanyl-D-alanine carboxypeptidase/D-alanyl-D-alanine-endopeptidase [Terriglobales bacterium]
GGDASAHAPLPFMVLATHESHPLAEDLTIINKESLNLHAEIMLRLLGHEKGSGGSIQSGSGVLKDFLTSAGIAPEEFVFLDGSGLSRQNLVTPAAVVKLLTYIDHQAWSETFRHTLPVAGVDGTLAVRFRGTPLEGRVFAKTGMLGHINALSGYATTLSGQRIAFSIMANNHNMGSHSAIQAVDRILSGIVDDRIPSGRRK